jgi:hypothetical protein
MRRVFVCCALVMSLVAGSYALAQTTSQSAPAKSQTSDSKAAWKFAFTVSETEDGKIINQREYSMLLVGDRRQSIRVGNRVPISTRINDTPSVQYMDVALSIDCQVREGSSGPTLAEVSFEISSLPPNQSSADGNPVTRFVRGSSEFVLTPDKKQTVLTADDVNSKRHYQFSVLATRMN